MVSRRPNAKDSNPREICQILRENDHYLLAAHVNPEGDSVASLLAMDCLLKKLGKQSQIVCQDPIPERLSFLATHRWKTDREIPASTLFDACVVLDCPTLERIGSVLTFAQKVKTLINLDHHVSNVKFGDYNLVNDSAAACGEILFDLYREVKIPIDAEDALYLYISIATDTGSFKYSNTTAHSHEIAADLIKGGKLNLEEVNERLYETYLPEKARVLEKVLSRLKMAYGGKVSWSSISQDALHAMNAELEDTDGFIDFIRYFKGVHISFFILETEEEGKVRVSFRSKGNYDVNLLAQRFSGGGHKKASGCTIDGTIEEAETKILTEIKNLYPNFHS